MRLHALPSRALSVLLLMSAQNASADLVTLTYENLLCCGGGHLTADPPPAGFHDALTGSGPLWARVVYDDATLPQGPLSQVPVTYRLDALRSITVGFGDKVFQTQFAADALGPFQSHHYVGSNVTGWDAFGLLDSGPSVLGLVPTHVNMSWTQLTQSPASFPSPDAFRGSLSGAGVTFRTPLGNNVNVELWSRPPVVSPVPEPATALLLMAGALVIATRRRRVENHGTP